MKLRKLRRLRNKIGNVASRRISSVARIRHDHRVATYRQKPLLNDVVLYEAFDGAGIVCSPGAIFHELIRNPTYARLRHVWVLRTEEAIEKFNEIYAHNEQVEYVKYRTAKYFEFIARSKYLINNSTFPAEFMKRTDQVYLNTWHGVPIKKMGFDVENGRQDVRNVLRNFLSANYLVSSGSAMTTEMYRDAFKLKNIYEGEILEVGLPRNDVLHSKSLDFIDVENLLDSIQPNWRGKKIVLFAPTWRGANPFKVSNESSELIEWSTLLQQQLGNDYLVLCKFHQLLERQLSKSSELVDQFIESNININSVLNYVDILVTDFSSIFIDFLLLDRPIHFFVPNALSYEEERGLYRRVDEFPGHVSSTISDLSAAIRTSEPNGYAEQRADWREKCLDEDHGMASRLIVDKIFGPSSENAKTVCLSSNKKRILIHVGSLIPNGITTAAINLLHNLDYDKYDVTVIYPFSSNEFQIAKSRDLDSRARILPRVGRVALKLSERRSYWAFTKGGGENISRKHLRRIPSIFSQEYRRCLGETKFDIALGFDGYQVFWTKLLLQSSARLNYLWAHNDLSLDAHRLVHGEKPHFRHLNSVFTLYHNFTGIVSVTDDLTKINRSKLSAYANPDKFVTVRNFLDAHDIINKAELESSFSFPDASKLFVTVGRLSPEKNQARIIRAFATVLGTHPDAMLVVIGDGPLRTELERLVINLGIESSVFFSGLQENPYPYMKMADCFVFSSEYEGQGLVILESLVLGVSVISTRFNVVDSVLAPLDGLIVDASDASLAQAMIDFVYEGLPVPTFNADEYNSSTMLQLKSILSILN